MSGSVEHGICDFCGKEDFLQRTYFRYNIKCDCHSPQHFELMIHCKNCIPIEPINTKISFGSNKIIVETNKLKTITKKVDIKDYIRSLKLQKIICKNEKR